ncbi:unnamed protein product [Nezara viridula]|uniref:Uncharacterized protein n=1 Tax=Nezara viridula TaxID=85310 RepID=A0A9P0HI83_NEZVI|nr:unnamed protein product [Nezara viridula]
MLHISFIITDVIDEVIGISTLSPNSSYRSLPPGPTSRTMNGQTSHTEPEYNDVVSPLPDIEASSYSVCTRPWDCVLVVCSGDDSIRRRKWIRTRSSRAHGSLEALPTPPTLTTRGSGSRSPPASSPSLDVLPPPDDGTVSLQLQKRLCPARTGRRVARCGDTISPTFLRVFTANISPYAGACQWYL